MQDIYKQAIDLQFKLRTYLDDPNHPATRQLQVAVQRLTDDIEAQKNARSLEEEVKQIIQQLEEAEGSSAISNQHLDDLRDRCEDMRRALRQLQ